MIKTTIKQGLIVVILKITIKVNNNFIVNFNRYLDVFHNIFVSFCFFDTTFSLLMN